MDGDSGIRLFSEKGRRFGPIGVECHRAEGTRSAFGQVVLKYLGKVEK